MNCEQMQQRVSNVIKWPDVGEPWYEVEQTRAYHCNKTIIGTQVGQVQTRIPVYEGGSQELIVGKHRK